MSFVHCNKCVARKTSTNTFYVTNCCHLYCNECVDQENPFCTSCSRSCRLMKVDAGLPGAVKSIFEKNDGKLDVYKKSVKFQNQQMLNYIQRKKQCIQEYQRNKASTIKLKEQMSALSKAIDKEKQLIRKLREAFKRMEGNSEPIPPSLNESPVSPGILSISTPSIDSSAKSSGYTTLRRNDSIFKAPSTHSGSSQSSAGHRSVKASGSSASEPRNLQEDLYKQMMRAKMQRDGRIPPNLVGRSHATDALPPNLNKNNKSGGSGGANSIFYNHKL